MLNDEARNVLILVLMEDTLREVCLLVEKKYFVLILVLMEDTLRDMLFSCASSLVSVLILVLMEDTLREV